MRVRCRGRLRVRRVCADGRRSHDDCASIARIRMGGAIALPARVCTGRLVDVHFDMRRPTRGGRQTGARRRRAWAGTIVSSASSTMGSSVFDEGKGRAIGRDHLDLTMPRLNAFASCASSMVPVVVAIFGRSATSSILSVSRPHGRGKSMIVRGKHLLELLRVVHVVSSKHRRIPALFVVARSAAVLLIVVRKTRVQWS